MPNTLARLVDLMTTIATMPVARLEFRRDINPDHAEKIYKHFTKRHPRYKVIQNKTFGAALVDLAGFRSREDYMETIKGRNSAEHHARRAKARGYLITEIDRNNFIDEIHEINNSLEIRQGRQMDPAYLEKKTHYVSDRNFKCYGVFNSFGKLVAYSELAFYGNFAAFNRVIGIRNNDGIMHLMVTEIICQMIDDGSFNYIMYDTYLGASQGLRLFKSMFGFQPYRAKYSLR